MTKLGFTARITSVILQCLIEIASIWAFTSSHYNFNISLFNFDIVQPVNKGRGGGGGVGSGGGGSVRPGSLPRMRDHHSPVPSRASPGGSLIIRKPNWVPPGMN